MRRYILITATVLAACALVGCSAKSLSIYQGVQSVYHCGKLAAQAAEPHRHVHASTALSCAWHVSRLGHHLGRL